MYTECFQEGEPYTNLRKCITINLVSAGFKLNRQVHSVYRILEQERYQRLTDLLEIHFLNLALAQKMDIQKQAIEKREKLINWLRFIATDDQKERAMLAVTSPVLQMLNEKIDVLSLSPEERRQYESRMKLKSDIATISEVQFKAGAEWGLVEGEARGLAEGKSVGLAEGKSLGLAEGKSLGLAEGSRQKALETAKLMLQRNYPQTEICLMTGLSKEEVERL